MLRWIFQEIALEIILLNKFLKPDGSINTDLMPDLIHPNAAGAEAWVQAIEPTLTKLMGDK